MNWNNLFGSSGGSNPFSDPASFFSAASGSGKNPYLQQWQQFLNQCAPGQSDASGVGNFWMENWNRQLQFFQEMSNKSPWETVNWLNNDALRQFVDALNSGQSVSAETIKQSLSNLSQAWFNQAAATTNLIEPEWLKTQLIWLDAAQKQLKKTVVPGMPAQMQEQVDGMATYFSKWQRFLQSIEALASCFRGMADEVTEDFSTTVEKAGQIDKVEELFSLWARCFEGIYEKITTSEDYQQAYGGFITALSEWKIANQERIDSWVESLGLPSRREMSTVLERIARLRANVRTNESDASEKEGQQQLADIQRKVDEQAQLLIRATAEIENLKTALSKQAATSSKAAKAPRSKPAGKKASPAP